MRLLRLELAGFGAFREHTTFDFEDTDFFALIGPTGSGKSTVVDAICFAFYGCVPRYEDKRMNRYVVTLGSSEAKVLLSFELSGQNYVATRVVRRTPAGQFSTEEARLELIENGEAQNLAGSEKQMNTAVEQLLHLGFDDFTRCVVLPQGAFAEFLRAKGSERRDLLIRLLNYGIYERVGQAAGKLADRTMGEIDSARRDLIALEFATPQALKDAKASLKAIERLKSDAEKARPKIEEHQRLAQSEQSAAEEARRLAGLLGKTSVPDAVRKHGTAHQAAQATLTERGDKLEAVRGARQAAEGALVGLPDVAVLTSAKDAHDRLAALATELADAKNQAETAASNDETTKKAVETVTQEHASALQTLEELRRAHQAADLARKLVVGEPCPVCLEVVHSLSEHQIPKELPRAEQAEAKAKKAIDTARAAHEAATRVWASAKGKVESLEGEQVRLLERIKAFPDAKALVDLRTDVDAKRAAAEQRRKEEDAAVKARDEAQSALDKLNTEALGFQAAYAAQRDGVSTLAPPEPGRGTVLADWEALVAWAGPTKLVQEDRAKKAADQATEAQKATSAQLQTLVDVAEPLGVALGLDIVSALAALSAAQVTAKTAVSDLEAAIKRRVTLEKTITDGTERAEVAVELRKHLRSNNFPEWLISEALGVLVDDASKTLRTLTNDAFSLALGENEFLIIDHANADERRPARTLSGGETFQASLALALSLSAHIRSLAAAGAPQLDALFLDEGFGTLDPETLETVASTIESLGSSGRMVGIITHVRELAERVPVRFEIKKGARTATIEKIYT